MARSRNLKPGFFVNDQLVELPFETRLLFAGLWTLADRKGRLEDRPKKIKIAIFPADDVDVDGSLSDLHDAGLIARYMVDDKRYIEIRKFLKHQNPHLKESASVIPAPDEHGASTILATPLTSSLIPESLTPQPADSEECVHSGVILDGVKTRLGLKKLPGVEERAWLNYASFAFENGFSADDFLECLMLLQKQDWRSGSVKPKHVFDNLPNLDKIRREIAKQGGNTTTASYAHVRNQPTQREAIAAEQAQVAIMIAEAEQ